MTLTPPKYHIVEDSVAGQRCFIIYQGMRPVHTLWEETLNYDILAARLGDSALALERFEELGDVATAVKALGGTRAQVRGALETWLKEKGWLEPRKQHS